VRHAAFALAVLAAACGGSRRAGKPAPPAPQRDLWSLAPPATRIAVALRYEESYRLLVAAERAIKEAPGAESVLSFMGTWLDYPRVDMRSAEARNRVGFDPDGPHVYFIADGGVVTLARLSDRAAYVRTFAVRKDPHSRGRLTVDADGSVCAAEPQLGYHLCGNRELLLAILDGKGMRVPWPPGGEPITARVWVAPQALGAVGSLTGGGEGLFAELEVGSGALVARAHLTGQPAGQLAHLRSGPASPLAAQLPDRDLAGAAVLNLIGWVDAVRAQAIENSGDENLTSKVSVADVWNAVRGDASVWVAPDDRSGALSIGLRRTEPIRKLLAQCEDLSLPGIQAARDGDRCRLRIGGDAGGTIDVVVRLGRDALVADIVPPKEPPPRGRAAPVPRDVMARLRRGEDGLVLWGSGLLAQLMSGRRPNLPQGRFALWAGLHIDESAGWLRFDEDGIRAELRLGSVLRYDQADAASVEPILRRLAGGEDVAAELERIAASRPNGALARDLARGRNGALVPVLSAVVVAKLGAVVAEQFAATRAAGAGALSAMEEVAEAACRCRSAECAERAAERYQEWENTWGKEMIHQEYWERVRESAAEAAGCIEKLRPAAE
jgi:hypothetical protein